MSMFENQIEQMEVKLPLIYKQKLDIELARLQKRANKTLKSFLKWDSSDVTLERDEGKNTYSSYVYFTIWFSTLKIPNWSLIGQVEHLNLEENESGNILIDYFPAEIPSYFKHINGKCDHCLFDRDRKKTFILWNDTEKSYHQVGTNCVKDFTGYDPEKIIELLELKNSFNLYKKSLFKEEKNSAQFVVSIHSAISASIEAVKDGFRTSKDINPSWVKARDLLLSDNVYCESEKSKEIIDFYINMNANSQLLADIKCLMKNDYLWHKDLGKFVWGVFHALQEFKPKDETHHIGEIGSKELGMVRFISKRDIQTFFGPSTIVNLEDFTGNKIVYFTTTKFLPYEGLRCYEYTIKKHDEFRGIKQTVVSRMKAVA